ncbi:response regulator [Trichodelitschia bisporula]|uniref:Transcription factor n=1 Tax=Trichodelitschia bisporula TaxID=703511 RepID=A0A6G1I2Z8_9PEZI|nr:response regulator [Trichodelitschia bisporula]
MEANSGGGGATGSSDFVRKLYKMLENPADNTVVRWGLDGESFVVLDTDVFTKQILPKHFKHSNFASFVRQLNKYDFHKVRHNNEDSAHSPYGPRAWEFKHPDFKANNKDALENIRRKAPAPRKAPTTQEDSIPTQQMDMMNTQLVATQQQLVTLQELYNDLRGQNNMLTHEVLGLQKAVINHEHVMENVMAFLNTVDSQRRRDSRLVTPFPANGHDTTTEQQRIAPAEDDAPASPLQHAAKLLSETNADQTFNVRALEHLNEQSIRLNHTLTTPPPDIAARARPSSRQAPNSASSAGSMRMSELDSLVYPVGPNNGIDPMFEAHIHNIPYTVPPTRESENGQIRKKNNFPDPGWVRQPRILLVEDDPTCRRIGSKFLYNFQCHVDCAFDGMEAVTKVQSNSKYDLVLMDIIMPNLDGISACSHIRRIDNTPVIAMTSNIRSDDIAMYFQHGMNDVLPKPFTKDGLHSILVKHLAHLKGDPRGLQAPGAQQAIKDDEPPTKSPVTAANWHSPNQMPGVSPVGAGPQLVEEYHALPTMPGQLMQGPLVSYGGLPAQQGPMPGMQYAPTTGAVPPQMQLQAKSLQPQMQHRRKISELSSAPEDAQGVDAKRPRMLPQVSQPQPVPQPQGVQQVQQQQQAQQVVLQQQHLAQRQQMQPPTPTHPPAGGMGFGQ